MIIFVLAGNEEGFYGQQMTLGYFSTLEVAQKYLQIAEKKNWEELDKTGYSQFISFEIYEIEIITK